MSGWQLASSMWKYRKFVREMKCMVHSYSNCISNLRDSRYFPRKVERFFNTVVAVTVGKPMNMTAVSVRLSLPECVFVCDTTELGAAKRCRDSTVIMKSGSTWGAVSVCVQTDCTWWWESMRLPQMQPLLFTVPCLCCWLREHVTPTDQRDMSYVVHRPDLGASVAASGVTIARSTAYLSLSVPGAGNVENLCDSLVFFVFRWAVYQILPQ